MSTTKLPHRSEGPSLFDQTVLLVDCQATASSPRKGYLLEIGWLATRADDRDALDALAVQTSLVALPEGQGLPAPVRRLTGIDEAMLVNAAGPEAVWSRLCTAAGVVARKGGLTRCPTVIHFARFEVPFLNALHQACGPALEFPLDVVCTHEIARRLYPSLPRKGLRALAGYLGCSVPMIKRCADHLRATAAIWRQVVQVLANDHGVSSFSALQQWLVETPVPRAMPRSYPMAKGRRQAVPDRPGVYRFLRANGDLLYIGKARSLKVRLNSYFQPARRHAERTLEMLSQAMRIEVTPTDSALEAALLESEAIKRFEPPYNVALTTDARALHFFSRDFAVCAERPDPVCRNGPVLSCDLIDTVHAIGRALGAADDNAVEALPSLLFARSEERGVDGCCIREGLALLARDYADLLAGGQVWRALMAIGRRRWIERMAESQAADGAGEDAAEETDEAVVREGEQLEEVTPEVVCRRLVSVLCHCSHQLRRARWLTLLSEAVVAWERPGSAKRRVVVIADGELQGGMAMNAHAILPRPSGAGRPWPERQRRMDLQRYDRLRVLTTEVRRLLAEDRAVWIGLGPAVLDATALRRLLQWL